ncbi:MAG: hypothetical protein V1824_01175 [archaeon]
MFEFFKNFGKKNVSEAVEIDDDMVRASYKAQSKIFLDYKNYRDKSIDWLLNHLTTIEDIIKNKTIGTRKTNAFTIEGKKFFKSDTTKEYFNRMFDSYNAYYYALKRYIEVRKELAEYGNLKEDQYLTAGTQNELDMEAKQLEKNLNVYLDTITKMKQAIRAEVGLSNKF